MKEIRSPQHEPGAERRPIVTFAAIMIILLGLQFGISKFGPKPAPPQEGTQRPAKTEEKAQSAPSTPLQTPPQSAVISKQPVPSPALKQAASETETVVENELIKVTFTNRGALVKSWILKKHLSDDQKQPLDMVNKRAAEAHGYPLSLFTWDETVGKTLNTAMYVPSATGTQAAPASVTFEYADGQLSARKTFSFESGYVIRVSTEVRQNGNIIQAFSQWPSGLADQLSGAGYASTRIDHATSGEIVRKAPQEGVFFKSHISDGENVNGPFLWSGIVDQYFAAIFMPDSPPTVKMVRLHKTIPRDPNADAEKQRKEFFNILGVAVGDVNGPTSMRLFVGPKDLDTLQKIVATGENGRPNGNLEGVVDFGFFAVFAKPLFLWLRWTYEHWTPNWGWAIVILTIVINVVLFPLRYAGMKSAYKQQKIAPEVKAINRRYEGLKITDPRQQEKQREIQALYKREGINPVSGCIPMLIQIPFLFAFYSMLMTVNELRHAQWMWLKDLSAPDPYYVLPLGIMVSMYFMQKMTPMTGMDPAQVKMMQVMMPVMIGVFSFTLPSGLGVYWLAGNMIGIVTQYLMNNSKHAREAREHLAKREARKGKKG